MARPILSRIRKKFEKNLIRGDRRITGVVATHPAAGEARVDIVCQDYRHFPWAGEPPSTHKAKQIGRRGARVHPIGKRRRRFQLATSAECRRRPPEKALPKRERRQSILSFALDTLQRKQSARRRQQTRDHRLAMRLSAVLWREDGRTESEVAHLLGICTRTVRNWLRLYRQKGLDAEPTHQQSSHRQGRWSGLTPAKAYPLTNSASFP